MVGGQLIQLNVLLADDARLEVAHHVEAASDLFVYLFVCLFYERNVCLCNTLMLVINLCKLLVPDLSPTEVNQLQCNHLYQDGQKGKVIYIRMPRKGKVVFILVMETF